MIFNVKLDNTDVRVWIVVVLLPRRAPYYYYDRLILVVHFICLYVIPSFIKTLSSASPLLYTLHAIVD